MSGVNWGTYFPYAPLHRGLLAEKPRREARAEFRHLMAAREERKAALVELLRVNGVVLTNDDAGVDALDTWFCANVELSSDDPRRLRNLWYAVSNDIGLFMGDLSITQSPNLYWALFTWGGKRAINYHRAVIMGFDGMEISHYAVNFVGLVAIHGLRVAMGLREDPKRLVMHIDSVRVKAALES